MPTFYGPRKTTRAFWTQEDLDKAIKSVQNQNVSLRQAAIANNIPEKTLRTRLKKGNFMKGTLGKKCYLGEDAEKKLVNYVKKLQSSGFAPSKTNLRKIAFNLSEKLGLKQMFNREKRIAGTDWYKCFMKRNPTLSVRKPRGMSNARASAMNKQEINNYFNLLNKCLNDYNLMNKPSNIYNMDEIGLQLNNEPDLVVAVKGNRNVEVRQCTERDETITVVACCNAEGSFLPPYCIFKGVEKQQIWEENMPSGCIIQMRKESAYINEQLFMDWLKNHFIPRKTRGQCLLILDGHRSHINSPDMLQMAADNNIHVLCLPSHTTHYFQPLDRSFFKPLKTYFRNACREWGNANPTKKITRHHFGILLEKAWCEAATTQTGISGFRATGIYPFCPTAIPEHAYLETAIAEHDESSSTENDEYNKEISYVVTINSPTTQMCTHSMTDENITLPGPSIQQPSSAGTSTEIHHAPVNKSLGKLLKEISPKTGHVQASRRKQSATLVINPSIISIKREKRRSKELSTRSIGKDVEIDSNGEKHEAKNSSLQNASVIKNENTTSTVNDVVLSDFLYVDTNQQCNLDNSQIDYWDEKSVSIDSQDPIEFAIQVNSEGHQQSQRTANFEDDRSPNEKGPCKQDTKVISEDVIAPTIDFLLAEVKANGSNDPELNFYRSLIPDIMKLSDKRRRQFKEVVLCTLNKLLDEDEDESADANT